MASIKERLQTDIKQAMKAGEKSKLGTLRLIHAAIRKKEIDERKDLDDAGVIKVISSMAKQRQDSIEQFKSGGRDDLVEKETTELNLLKQFLPEQMSKDELGKIVEAAVQEIGATSPKEMGAVMKLVLAKVAGRADGKLVSQVVREKLQ